jgi:hypothetical protein
VENLVGNEENGKQVPDSNKTMINVTNEPTNNPSKRKLWKRSLRNSWRRH